MSKRDKDSKNILTGALIGGVIGVAATLFFASKNGDKENRSSLSSLGRLIVHMGEMLNAHDVNHTPIIKDVEKKVHKHEDTVSDVLEFISSSMHLWEKIRKGL